MQSTLCHDCPERISRPRGRVSPWIPVALIAAVLGAASLASAFTTDTRDFTARHGSVLESRAL